MGDAYIVWPADGTDSFILYHIINVIYKMFWFEQLVTSAQCKDGILVKNIWFSFAQKQKLICSYQYLTVKYQYGFSVEYVTDFTLYLSYSNTETIT